MHKAIKLTLAVVFSALSIYAFAAVDTSAHKKHKPGASQTEQASVADKDSTKADEIAKPAAAVAVAGDNPELTKNITEKLKTAYPQIAIDSLAPSPVAGWHQLTSGALVMYVSDDAHYLFYGELLDLNVDESDRNVTENVRREFRVGFLKTLKVEDMIVYPTKKKAKAVVMAFLDSDCAYCKRLHSESAQLAEDGIEMRYLAFPRAGVGSETYNHMVSAWCAEDRVKALDSLMKGDKIPSKECSNPVANQFLLGQKLGISGTPTLVFEDGTIIPGYMPADKLATEAVKHHKSH